MNTSITDKLPIDTVADAIGDAVAESVHLVGDLVPDGVTDVVPDSVTDVVVDGVSRGRRLSRNMFDRLPGRSAQSNSKRWVIAATVLGLIGVALVVWRVRSSRNESTGTVRDDWRFAEVGSTKADSPNRGVA